ncbi:hypothetical protein J6590_012262 [Homalodisca vitripennis]|nr:hypothetical protein J6590_012262 [Homalodisca vitripennis]
MADQSKYIGGGAERDRASSDKRGPRVKPTSSRAYYYCMLPQLAPLCCILIVDGTRGEYEPVDSRVLSRYHAILRGLGCDIV